MRVAISATGPTLDADVGPRFGRCQYFIIVDPETMEFEALENSRTDWGTIQELIDNGNLVDLKYQGQKFYMRKLPGRKLPGRSLPRPQ